MISAISSAAELIGPLVKNHLWQSTAFVGIAAVIASLLRKNPARFRYWVWLAASAKFLIPFSLLISLGGSLPKPVHTALPNSPLFGVVDQFAQPFGDTATIPFWSAQPSVQSVSPVRHVEDYPVGAVVLWVWLSGALVVFGVWGLYWNRVARNIRRGTVLNVGREVEAIRRLEKTFGIKNRIAFIRCDSAAGPGIYGMAKPVLIWPATISDRLDDSGLDSVLAHEVCHVRRHDNFTALIHMMVEAIFWFHPLVWWMGSRLARERERACDEEALRVCNRPEVYAESILTVCEFCLESDLPCVSGITGADLKDRIQYIMSGAIAQKLSFRRKILLLVAALAVPLTPIMAGAITSPGRNAITAATAKALHTIDALASGSQPTLLPSQTPAGRATDHTPPQSRSLRSAEDIAEIWQGVLHTPFQGNLRVVLKIEQTSEGGWSAVYYSIDQSPRPLLVDGIVLEDEALHFSIPSVNGRFEGKLSEDGRTIVGKWFQGGSLSLTFERANKSTAWQLPTPSPIPQLEPMPAQADPSFKAAIILPSDPAQPGRYFHTGRSAVTTHATSLSALIQFAYGIQAKQIIDGPAWIDKDLYDLTAVPDTEGQPSESQEKMMFQKLLVSRFKLLTHHTRKQVPVFFLTGANAGTKNLVASHSRGQLPSLFFRPTADGIQLPARNATMNDFVITMQQTVLDRPLVNKTGLVGRFDFTLTWNLGDMQLVDAGNGTSISDSELQSLTTALYQQLGLELVGGELPLDVLVIDHVGRPSN